MAVEDKEIAEAERLLAEGVDPQLGALARAYLSCDWILGGAQTRERFERDLVSFVRARDYSGAALALAILCVMAERGVCDRCEHILDDGRCVPCEELEGLSARRQRRGRRRSP